MSSGYSGSSVVILSNKQVKKLLPKEFKEFEKASKKVLSEKEPGEEFDFGHVIRESFYSPDDNVITGTDADKKLKDLQNEFSKKFKGMRIFPFYHDGEDDGDIYDEFEGEGWEVGGAYQKTKSALKLESQLKDNSALDYVSMTFYG